MRLFLFSCYVVSDSFATPVDCSPPGSSVHGILQARILKWVAISFSRGSSNPGIELESPALEGRFFTAEPPGKPMSEITYLLRHNLCFLHGELSINRRWHPTPVLLPGKSHGRSLVGCSPFGSRRVGHD